MPIHCIIFYSFISLFLSGEIHLKWIFIIAEGTREGVQRRHDPRKNDLRTSGFAELPPGPAKLVSQPQ